MNFKVEVHTKIGKPIAEVFDAVVNPGKVGSYFATGGVNAPMAEGRNISWIFKDISFEQKMKVRKLVENKKIELDWFTEDGKKTVVSITFDKLNENRTMITIVHSGYEENQQGLEDSYSHCEGWTVMLASMKAYLEYGINLADGYW
ncbi:MAG: SRPBCC domain-containing protein [Candidatus Thermoplasmatota archaeon]|nr:SRPBCC domain-containing protein [Candidatus Thermoplasmatota archaeon]